MVAPALPYASPGRGRPTTFTADLAKRICDRIAEGESLRSVCRDESMPSKSSVMLWLSNYKDFSDQYGKATEARADHWADEIVTISDDGSNDTYVDDNGKERTDTDVIARSKLRVDTRKWLMARMAPKKYGDKITQEHQGAGGGALVVEIVRLSDVPNPTA